MSDKIVEFEKFCKDCVHYEKPETDDPCNECLGHTVNEDSHKPVKFQKGVSK